MTTMSRTRFSQIKAVLVGILIANWLVAVAKLVVGALSGSASLFADGIHSFADGASNVVGLIGITIAAHPADEDHPYGHRKFETLSAQVIAVMLLLACYEILRSAVQRVSGNEIPQVNWISFAIMGVTITVNAAVTIYEQRQGRKLQSDLLLADALHTRTDILVSLSVIGSLVAAKAGIPHIDSIIAIGIGFYIAGNAVWMLWQTSDVLADKIVLDTKEIERVVMEVEGVKACHEIRSRGRRDDIHIDLHMLVDDRLSVEEAHHQSFLIEEKLKARFLGVSDVVVHIEPLSHRHELP